MNNATVWFALGGFVIATSCGPGRSSSTPPATPAAAIAKEGDLLRVHLSEAAEQRRGITTAPLDVRLLPRLRRLAGEVRIPPGRSVVLTAPVAGTLAGVPPAVGTQLENGSPILELTPLLSPDARANFAALQVDAEGSLAAAIVQRDATEIALDRAMRLLRDGAGSQRGVDEATAARDAARAVATATRARRDLLASAVAGTLGPLHVTAPFAGLLRQLLVAPGQQVAAGAPLCEVADVTELWIRVPVFVEESAALDTTRDLRIADLAARPVSAPPAADPVAATVDVFYAVADPQGTLRPGQRVVVAIPQRGDASPVATMPWSAVHTDLHGGTWVYERTADRTYVRRRVRVSSVVDGVAAIDSPPPPGAQVVTSGVPELFGIEFGHAR